MTRTLVLGVGNPDRGDDAAGIEVVRRLRARRPPGALLRECSGDAASLLEAWRGRRRVIVVDAASGGGPPGTVRRFEAHRRPLPAGWLQASTHSLGVAEAVELGRALGRLPPSLVVYGIEAERFDHGRALSPPVRRAVERVARRILRGSSGPFGRGPRRRQKGIDTAR